MRFDCFTHTHKGGMFSKHLKSNPMELDFPCDFSQIGNKEKSFCLSEGAQLSVVVKKIMEGGLHVLEKPPLRTR